MGQHLARVDGDADGPLRALIFDSVFDQFRGVVAYVRVVDGSLQRGQRVKFFSNPEEAYEVLEVGIFRLDMIKRDRLDAGDVGYLIAGVKTIGDATVGDTVVDAEDPAPSRLPGYKPMKPMVFSGLYPVNTADYEKLKASLDKAELDLKVENLFANALKTKMPRFDDAGMHRTDSYLMN